MRFSDSELLIEHARGANIRPRGRINYYLASNNKNELPAEKLGRGAKKRKKHSSFTRNDYCLVFFFSPPQFELLISNNRSIGASRNVD